MAETTSNEFLDWQEFLEKEEWHNYTRDNYYMAQIAQQIANQYRKGPPATIEDFLIKFVKREDDPKAEEEIKEQRLAMSKAKWFGLTGVGRIKPPTRPPPQPVNPANVAPRAPRRKKVNGGDSTRT